MDRVEERLGRIVEEFADLDGREKLELLLDHASSLPPIPADYAARKEERRVHECQTPVYLWVVLEGDAPEPAVRLVAEVAEEAPTVKGFVAILAEALHGRPAGEALTIPDDLLERLGLADVLGMMRARGLRAIVDGVKRRVVDALGTR